MSQVNARGTVQLPAAVKAIRADALPPRGNHTPGHHRNAEPVKRPAPPARIFDLQVFASIAPLWC